MATRFSRTCLAGDDAPAQDEVIRIQNDGLSGAYATHALAKGDDDAVFAAYDLRGHGFAVIRDTRTTGAFALGRLNGRPMYIMQQAHLGARNSARRSIHAMAGDVLEDGEELLF